ncbi:MAG: chromosome segregation protein SMC, partial [Halobacteriota archaeon]
GVAPEGYNVVMQGDVTEIINMTPYQRRGIVDEIAGVAEFDAKKEDAFEELETVKDRISEADLRIEEKRSRLDQLADERETALEYQSLREEKREYEGYLKAAELEDKRDSLDRTRSNIETTESQLESLRSVLDERTGRVERLRDELDSLNREIERKGEDEQLRIKSEIEEVKGEISRFEGKIETAEERIADAENERRQAFVEIDRKQERVDDLESEIRDVKVEKASIKGEVQRKQRDLESVEAEIADVDTEYDELQRDLSEKKAELESLKTEKNDLQRQKDRLLDETRRSTNQISAKQAELERFHERIPELKARLSDLHSELDKARKNEQKAEDIVAELRDEKRELSDELDAVTEEIRTKQSEYADLEARAGGDGGNSYPRAVTTILNAGMSGVHGTVGKLGSVPSEYATACETAAGGRLAHVVVDDDGVGASCIDYLKQRNAGRATFLPITKMDDRGLPNEPNHPGVVDFAYNLVEFNPDYSGVFSYVLGSTLVVEDMSTARDLMGRYRLVTLDGGLVEKSGAMTGGSGGGSRYSFSKSGKGKLERIAAEITDLEERRHRLRDEIRSVDEDLEDARDRQTNAADRVRAVEGDIERAEDDLAAAKADIETHQSDLESLREQREAVDERMQALDEDLADRNEQLAAVRSAIEDLEAELADSKIPELTSKADEIRGAISEREDRMDELDGRLNELQLEKRYADESIEDLHETVEKAQNRKVQAESDIDDYESEIETREAVLEEKREAVSELETELAELKAERRGLQERFGEAKEAREEQREQVSSVESKLDTLGETVTRLEWEIDALEDEVGDYDPGEIPDHATVEQNVDRLEREMEALEPVNMLAIDEYDAVESALEDLQDGRDVLAEERDGIRDRIERYEAQKRTTFMTAFDAINDQFQDIFERLSNGSGELHLENPEDPFEAGLTMKAQPGDKPIQRLDAMSGGEKSLTALAFIFAIQRHNPAPFYALDEVDAFLDAANAERVGEMVDDLAGDAQFIVVSHRSALLERSERVIGVTMQGDNVSAVTGIQLGDSDAEEAEVSAGG